MNIQQLKYVTAVANNGSFREAAKKLFVSQPSLSAAIKELENELGIHLFTRTHRGAYLTEDGQAFLKRAERILIQLESLENYYLTAEKRESFSIASQHYDFLGPLTAKLIEEFKEEIKQFRIMETTTATVIEEVQQQHSELGILYMNDHNRAGIKRYLEQGELVAQSLGRFKTHIFLRQGHPLANQKEIRREELSAFPQVRFTQDGSNFPYFYEDLIEIPEQESVIYTSDRGTLMNIVLETNAYASGSGIVIGEIKEYLRLIPLADSLCNELYVIYSTKHPLSDIAQRFIRNLKEVIQQAN
ncbi:LysR family transcriptional regulator [Enterococcus sp. 10A9_DIV0425]|uniref:LysR family transcriptional regulator n=1 Tax=Candidatus Enterococcus wittei TaxID=1987383 RepID=A0A2C9XQ06_9ENTE|nr:LysR family transcriptional regulator [Enterococcus sp. 10A9_DIV0425]OTP11797.1 LysR family transcriptional regulator [Enterococcus sp. 10A9_DIV0425]